MCYLFLQKSTLPTISQNIYLLYNIAFEIYSEVAQIEIQRQQMCQELTEAKKEKVFLETQLDMERTKVEQEKKKILMAQEQISNLVCTLICQSEFDHF